MKVLVFAYACDPYRQSEMGLGWNISSEIARRHEVTLVTREKNRPVFERYLSEHPDSPHARTHFIYHDTNGIFRKLKNHVPFGTQFYFSYWLKTATQKYRKQIERADLVHQLTFCPFFVKPWGARYTDRYVWGPIGGGGGADARFPSGFSPRGISFRFTEQTYRVLSWFVYSPFAIGFSRLRDRVAAILFKAKAFSNGFPVLGDQIVAVTQETGYDGPIVPREYVREKHTLKIVAVGRMIPHKAFEYAIRGFAMFREAGGEGKLHLFGDGPLRTELESLAARILPAASDVVFHGNVSNAQIHSELDCADVYLHPSFIEAAAWSILEAMIHGVPVVCQNRSGMADMVADDCGIRVVGGTPDALASAFSSALMKYYQHPELIAQHGLAGQMRVRADYTWAAIGAKMNAVYDRVLSR